jgi:hypothetical protein
VKKYEVVMVVTVEATSAHQAARRMRLANKLAHEHLRGEWLMEPEVTWGPVEVSKPRDDRQQGLPL